MLDVQTTFSSEIGLTKLTCNSSSPVRKGWTFCSGYAKLILGAAGNQLEAGKSGAVCRWPLFFGKQGGTSGGVWARGRERDELRRQNEQLQKQVVDKDKTIADREKQIADLERQLAAYRKDSTNSSPPLDGPAQKDQEAVLSAPQKEQTQTRWSKGTPGQTPSPGAARAGRSDRGSGGESLPALWERFAEARRSGLPNRGRRAAPSSDGTAAAARSHHRIRMSEGGLPLLPEWHACAAAQGGPERLWTSVSGFGRVLDCDVPDAPPGGGKRTRIGAGDSHQPG